MDNYAAGVEGAAEKDPRDSAGADDRRRVEELLRVNQRLAAEVRSLALGRAEAPRSGAMTASRRLGALIEERDTLIEKCEALQAELEQARAGLGNWERAYAEMERDRDRLAAEVARLRGGWRGFLRRARARVLLRR